MKTLMLKKNKNKHKIHTKKKRQLFILSLERRRIGPLYSTCATLQDRSQLWSAHKPLFFSWWNNFMAEHKALFVVADPIPELCISLSTCVSSSKSWWWTSSNRSHTCKASRGLCETTRACVDRMLLSKTHRSPGTGEAFLPCVFARGVAGGLSQEKQHCILCIWRVYLLCGFWCELSSVLTGKTLCRSLDICTAGPRCANAGGSWVCWSVWRLHRSVHTGKAEYLDKNEHCNW